MGERLDGYGASIEFDGEAVRLIAGKAQAKIWKCDSVAFPIADVIEIGYRAANPLVNGQMTFETMWPANAYAPDRGMFAYLPDNGLIIHWRRKDQGAFAELHDRLAAQVEVASIEQRRAASAELRAKYAAERKARIQAAVEQATKPPGAE